MSISVKNVAYYEVDILNKIKDDEKRRIIKQFRKALKQSLIQFLGINLCTKEYAEVYQQVLKVMRAIFYTAHYYKDNAQGFFTFCKTLKDTLSGEIINCIQKYAFENEFMETILEKADLNGKIENFFWKRRLGAYSYFYHLINKRVIVIKNNIRK